jgi:Ca2+-binding RTX toxin-like protein
MHGLRILGLAILIVGATGVASPTATAAARVRRCLGARATIVAVAGAITNGTAGDDVISGTNGDDVIYGNGGNDRICGGSGDDVIYAYAPAEPLVAGKCVDSIDLDAPYTVAIVGGLGNDVICGPSSSGGGYWEAHGDGGGDVVGFALGVDEDVYGGSGNDTVQGALKYPGNLNSFSHAYGNSGRDVVAAGEMFFYDPIPPTPYEVLADGGSGADRVYGAAVDLLSGRLKGGSGTDTCEMVIGTATVELIFDPSCETQLV